MNSDTLGTHQDKTRSSDTVPVTEMARPKASDDSATQGKVLLWIEKYALLVFLAAVLAFFWISQPAFGSKGNLIALAVSQSVILVLALGLIIPLIAGNFDLSIGAVASFSSIIAAKCMVERGYPVGVALACGVVIAMVVGAFNGFLVAYLNLDALIATLGTAIVLTGLISWTTNDLSVTGISPNVTRLATDTILGIPVLSLLGLIVAAVVAYLIAQTPFGRRLTAIGSSRDAAELVGIRVRRLVLVSFVLSGCLGGIAGIFLLAQQGSGNPAVNPISLILPALAAVYLGASAISPGQFNVTGTIIGLLLVAALVSGLTLAGAHAWVQSLVLGGALIIAVGTSTALRQRRLGR